MPTSYVVSLLNAIRVATGLTVRAVYEGHVQYVPEWRPILTFAQVTAFRRESVKPSATPSQVRILDLPPPAETARGLGILGRA